MKHPCVFLPIFLILTFSSEKLSAQDTVPNKNEIVTKIANKKYKAGLVKKIFLGAHYRKEWSTPVEVNVFNINKEAGGLTPVKQGGSMQTTNLRLRDAQGHEYVLRSVDKTSTRALPEKLRNTIVGDIFQDQGSSENPFGPLVVPSLSKAAGVFYTNPKLVFIPYDTAFKEFTSTFANMLAYFEERPDGDMSHLASSGNSSKVIGTEKMFEHISKDHNNKVDVNLFARTRLFDMLIGDWGRHEDQWRWATYETEKGKIFKPIPRDRDHVFFKSDGIIPYLASRKSTIRKTQNFDYHFKDIIGLNLSATSIDRALLSGLTKEEWRNISESLKASLPDSIIDNAVKKMPANIYAIHGKEISEKLKSRRNDLTKAALKYYSDLSKVVDIAGSEKNEVFNVKYLNKHQTEITVLKKNNDTVYHRLFSRAETKEIRLYGLGGNDQFNFSEKQKKHPKIRIIREQGFEKSSDSAHAQGIFNQYIYSAGSNGNQLMSPTQIIFMRGTGIKNSSGYDRAEYHYNITALSPTYQFNVDDGLFLGFGLVRKTYGFHKYPYATYQTGGITYATKTGAVSFRYFGDFKKVVGNWNLTLDLRLYAPKYVLNYFGLGNESTQLDTNITYYRVKAKGFLFNPLIYKNITKNFILGFGPQYQYIEVSRTPGRFISSPESKAGSSAFDKNQYIGLKIFTQVLTLDNILFPKKGIRWNSQALYLKAISNTKQFINLSADFSVFYTPKFIPFITFGSRVGGATNIGEFEFFQANTLGGTTNLRGYRRTRYYGRTSFYHDTEARIKLFDVNFYLFPGKIGLILFYDYGRVWQDNEKSNLWHTGYGPGLWLQVYNRLALTGTYGFGGSNNFLNVQLGFLF